MIPTLADCYKLWDTYQLPQKKRIHSQLIAHGALFVAKKLQGRGITIDISLLEASCLLHDIDKMVPKRRGERHPESSVRILKEEGLDEVAEVVRTHSLHCILDSPAKPHTWEQKLLYMVDKMVKQEFVGVDGRFALWRAEDLSIDAQQELEEAYPRVKKMAAEVLEVASISEESIGMHLALDNSTDSV